LPLVLPVLGMQDLPRGARIRIQLGEIDEVTLDVRGTVLERLDALPPDLIEEETEDSEEEALAAGPLEIAVDVTPSEAPTGDNSVP
jgi:exoribonuclease-2